MHFLRHVCLFIVVVLLSFLRNTVSASEAQGELNVTIVSSVPLNETYSVLIQTLESSPISAEGESLYMLALLHIYLADLHHLS